MTCHCRYCSHPYPRAAIDPQALAELDRRIAATRASCAPPKVWTLAPFPAWQRSVKKNTHRAFAGFNPRASYK